MKKSTNHQMDTNLRNLLVQGVREGVFPGAAAAVSIGSSRQRKRFSAFAGIKEMSNPVDEVEAETYFDLASLSKSLSSTLILYSLIHEKRIELDTTLQDIFKGDTGRDKHYITVAQLLSHSSGFISYKPYFKGLPTESGMGQKKKLFQQIMAEPLAYEPGTDCQYSDMGFIVLGHLIEKITGMGLAENFVKRITAPLGLEHQLFYIPLTAPRMNKQLFAATEDCPWRGKVMRAEVHDEHCWLMNGVAGHAGLFGRVSGVQRLCEEILDQWKARGGPCSWSGMLAQGLLKRYENQSWCLGFDSPSMKGSSAGSYISPQSVGHLGYAGTSFWIDPDRELVMVLLTNRVHPSRENSKIRKFRPYFHNKVIEGMRKVF